MNKMENNSGNIKAIFADIGGIFVEVDFNKFIFRCLEKSSKKVKEIRSYLENDDLFLRYRLGKIRTKDFLHQLKSDLNFRGSLAELSSIYAEIFTPVDENIRIAKKLRQHYQLYAISNTNFLHAKRISKLGIYNLFDRCFLSFKIGVAKPDELIFKIVLEKTKAVVAESAFFDDGEENVKVAKRLGFKAKRVCQPGDFRNALINLGLVI